MSKKIIQEIKSLKQKIGFDVEKRLLDFKKNINKKDIELFSELCFCIIVANNSIENGLRAYNTIGSNFLKLEEKKLKEELKKTAKRFYNKRAEYIIETRKKYTELISKIRELEKNKKLKTENIKIEKEFRNWLVDNIKGFGFKEASHFMRNLGFFNFAILDRHILKFLYKNNIIKEIPKTITKKKYYEIENIIQNFSKKLEMSMAELDVYLFYIDSGRICEK